MKNQNELVETLRIAVDYIEEMIGSDADSSETFQYLLEKLKKYS